MIAITTNSSTSVNPAFVSAGNPRAGEGAVSEFLADKAVRAGLDVSFKKALPQRPNLLLTLRPRNKARRRILFAPHFDTVNGTDEQFVPRKSGGRMYGRGACDTKGALAAFMAAAAEISEASVRRIWRSHGLKPGHGLPIRNSP
jgi:acetylornithine deacetylase/succinyl-diaminopimelate desuccinylase-like protein